MPVDNNVGGDLINGFRQNGVTNFCQSTKPSAIAIGDTWYKPSDGSEWFWNGIYWLSKETLVLNSDYSPTQIIANQSIWGTAFSGRDLSSGRAGIYYVNAANAFYQSGATDATNYWQVVFYAVYSDGTIETLSTNTAANRPAGVWYEVRNNINSPKSSLSKTTILVYADITKFGASAGIFTVSSVQFKWIHP